MLDVQSKVIIFTKIIYTNQHIQSRIVNLRIYVSQYISLGAN